MKELSKSGSQFRIRVASSAAELESVYQFRYKIYVEEMKLVQKYADHARRRIEDPLDRTAINLSTTQAGVVVGTARINHVREGGMEEYLELYGIAGAGEALERSSFVTRLMVEPHLRAGVIGARMCMLAYDIGLWDGIEHCYIDCQPHMAPLFHALGFKQLPYEIVHKEYGRSLAMRLDLHDEAHLEAHRSPFLRSLRLWKDEAAMPAHIPAPTGATRFRESHREG